jgi:hypothetical protein
MSLLTWRESIFQGQELLDCRLLVLIVTHAHLAHSESQLPHKTTATRRFSATARVCDDDWQCPHRNFDCDGSISFL